MNTTVYAHRYEATAGAVGAPILAFAPQNNNSQTNGQHKAIKELMERLSADTWVSLTYQGAYWQLTAAMFAQAENAITASLSPLSIQTPQTEMSSNAPQRVRNQAAKKLILEWLADDSGYDEETWPILQNAIEENRLSNRKRFPE
jgi:hypothetical protein